MGVEANYFTHSRSITSEISQKSLLRLGYQTLQILFYEAVNNFASNILVKCSSYYCKETLVESLLCHSFSSSRPAVFSKKGERPATLLKKRLWHMCFPVNFANF